jgi:hypothetical protein
MMNNVALKQIAAVKAIVCKYLSTMAVSASITTREIA